MVITETTTRQCCQPQDLITINNNQRQCRHCGRLFVRKWFTDAAGDRDYDWIPDIDSTTPDAKAPAL
jgi:hypothetical protein